MIEGINVLNQTEILTTSETNRIILCISLIVLVVSYFVGVISSMCDIDWLFIISIIFIIVSFIFIIKTVLTGETEPTGRYRYEVTIDDSAPLIDFYEKYEIISQRGDIYVIEDKEVNNDGER